MNTHEIVTKKDLADAEERILYAVSELLRKNRSDENQHSKEEYLRTRDVRKLLSVSENKLKDMRLKREIPFIRLGSTFYYPASKVTEVLDKNLIAEK